MFVRSELEFCWPQVEAGDEAPTVHEAVALAHILILIYVCSSLAEYMGTAGIFPHFSSMIFSLFDLGFILCGLSSSEDGVVHWELEFWPQLDEAAAVHEAVALAHVLILIYVQARWNIWGQWVFSLNNVCLIWSLVLLASSCSKLFIADEAAAVHEAVALAHILILIYVQAQRIIWGQRGSLVIFVEWFLFVWSELESAGLNL